MDFWMLTPFCGNLYEALDWVYSHHLNKPVSFSGKQIAVKCNIFNLMIQFSHLTLIEEHLGSLLELWFSLGWFCPSSGDIGRVRRPHWFVMCGEVPLASSVWGPGVLLSVDYTGWIPEPGIIWPQTSVVPTVQKLVWAYFLCYIFAC